ncbi:MAG: rhodanese-like domain-containing protein [Verrucomicrobiales bacterium]|nr:rhodanese-like domain-containing protein [Verrucomicrobiales bacterium]
MKTIYTFPAIVIAASIFSGACQKNDAASNSTNKGSAPDTQVADPSSKQEPAGTVADKKPAASNEVKHVNAVQAAEYIKNNPATIVIDVRGADEFSNGHIKGAINVDFRSPSFADDLKKLDTSKTYLIHCQAGGRSSSALKIFKKLGFQHLLHLDGGMMDWGKEQLPIEK